jgi:phage-related protein
MSQYEPPHHLAVVWAGPARAELRALPLPVRRTMGIALWFAQQGKMHPLAKPMRGPLAGVVEVCVDAGRGTFRTMYTTKLGARVVVLAAFQKKSHEGRTTPRHLLERIAHRLAVARQELDT